MKMNKLLALVLAAVMVMALFPAAMAEGDVSLDFEDGNAGFVSVYEGMANSASADLAVADYNGGKALKIVGRGARLERSAAQYGSARILYGCRDALHLAAALDGARPRDHGKIPAAYLNAADVHDRVLRASRPAGELIWLRNGFNVFDRVEVFNICAVKPVSVADDDEDVLMLAHYSLHVKIVAAYPAAQILGLLGGRALL